MENVSLSIDTSFHHVFLSESFNQIPLDDGTTQGHLYLVQYWLKSTMALAMPTFALIYHTFQSCTFAKRFKNGFDCS